MSEQHNLIIRLVEPGLKLSDVPAAELAKVLKAVQDLIGDKRCTISLVAVEDEPDSAAE